MQKHRLTHTNSLSLYLFHKHTQFTRIIKPCIRMWNAQLIWIKRLAVENCSVVAVVGGDGGLHQKVWMCVYMLSENETSYHIIIMAICCLPSQLTPYNSRSLYSFISLCWFFSMFLSLKSKEKKKRSKRKAKMAFSSASLVYLFRFQVQIHLTLSE